jgi:hypothetical protein
VEPNGGVSLAIGGEVTDGSSTTATTVVTGSDETITKKADKISGTVANVTISSKLGSTAYTLDDVTITGDLIIESTGDITLDNVTVKGKIIVEGSNADVILKKNAEVGDVVFHDSGSISGTNFKGTLGTVTVDTDSKYDTVTLSVKADTVNVEDQCYLYIEKNVATLNVNSGAKNATIGIDYYAKVTEANVDAAIDLYGRGDIGTLNLNASNCTISRGLDITKTSKASGVKGTSYTYNDWYWGDAYKTYCTDHGVYDYCDWEYWYGDGWCPFHERYDDCWWDYGYGAYTPAAKTYSVSVKGTGLSCSTASVNASQTLSDLQLTVANNYNLNSVEITMGGTTVAPEKYKLDGGKITFNEPLTVTGNIVVTGKTTVKEFTVTVVNNTGKDGVQITISGVTASSGSTEVEYGKSFSMTVTKPSDGTLNFSAGDPNLNSNGDAYTVTLSSVTEATTITITFTSTGA